MNACVCECRCRNVWLREEKACMAFSLAHTCACSARRMCVMFMRLRLCLCVCERARERGCAKLQHFLAQIGREVTPMQEGSKKMQWNFSQMLAERGGGGGGVPGRVGGWIEEVRR